MPSKSDTIPAMLTPGEVVLNEKQQKALEKYVGQSREEIFGKIKVPGFNIGGKVKYKKYYKKGGEVKKKRSLLEKINPFDKESRDKREEKKIREWYERQDLSKAKKGKTVYRRADGTHEDEYGRDYDMKTGKTTYQTREWHIEREKKEREKRKKKYKAGGKVKNKKKYNRGGVAKKAYSRMYKAKWGG